MGGGLKPSSRHGVHRKQMPKGTLVDDRMILYIPAKPKARCPLPCRRRRSLSAAAADVSPRLLALAPRTPPRASDYGPKT